MPAVIRTLIFFLLVFCNLMLCYQEAQAEYVTAEEAFNQKEPSEKNTIVNSLILLSFDVGAYKGSFTKKINSAVEAFQKNNKFDATGVLDDEQLSKLASETEAYIESLGFKDYTLQKTQATLSVPRALFDKEIFSGDEFAFERDDDAISLSLKQYQGKTFKELKNKFTRTAGVRTVVYKDVKSDHFTAGGQYKRRSYVMWIGKTAEEPVGFTLSWSSSKNNSATGLLMLLSDRFSIAGEKIKLEDEAKSDEINSRSDGTPESSAKLYCNGDFNFESILTLMPADGLGLLSKFPVNRDGEIKIENDVEFDLLGVGIDDVHALVGPMGSEKTATVLDTGYSQKGSKRKFAFVSNYDTVSQKKVSLAKCDYSAQ